MELDTSAELTFCNKKKKTYNKQANPRLQTFKRKTCSHLIFGFFSLVPYLQWVRDPKQRCHQPFYEKPLHFQSKSKTNKTLFWTTSNSTSEQCPEAGSDRERPFTKILSGSVGWIPTLPHLHVWQLLSIKCGSQFCEKVCLEELAVTCQAEWKVRILLKKKKPWKDC